MTLEIIREEPNPVLLPVKIIRINQPCTHTIVIKPENCLKRRLEISNFTGSNTLYVEKSHISELIEALTIFNKQLNGSN